MPTNNVSYKDLAGIKTNKKSKKKELAAKTTVVDNAPLSPSTKATVDAALSPCTVDEFVASQQEQGECKSCRVLADLVRTLLKKQETLETDMADLKAKLEGDNVVQPTEDTASLDMAKKIKVLEKTMEDRINRQLRQTLVIRNIPEEADEKSWSDTTDVVADKIADLLHLEFDEARSLINRCHRGGKASYYREKNKVRPIYVAMMRWGTCEQLVNASRSQRQFYIDYKYAPLTTKRRNMALKLRRDLKTAGEIDKGFVKFPAILMGKKNGEAKYREIRNFSDEEISTAEEE